MLLISNFEDGDASKLVSVATDRKLSLNLRLHPASIFQKDNEL